jgi:hypothetical protein
MRLRRNQAKLPRRIRTFARIAGTGGDQPSAGEPPPRAMMEGHATASGSRGLLLTFVDVLLDRFELA